MTEPTTTNSTEEAKRQAVLERRALRLARSHDEAANDQLGVLDYLAEDWLADVALVRAGGREIGLPTTAVREILPRPPITPLPASDARILGLAQVRGRILAVTRLAALLEEATGGARETAGEAATELPENETCSAPSGGHLALVDTSSGPLALLVDEVAGFRRLRRSELAEGFQRSEGASAVRAITRDLVLVIDVDRLLPGSEAAAR